MSRPRVVIHNHYGAHDSKYEVTVLKPDGKHEVYIIYADDDEKAKKLAETKAGNTSEIKSVRLV